jgi:hypothetical protein
VDIERITIIAQKITFAFEDLYLDKTKREMFIALFNRYLTPVDPAGVMEPYDAIVSLGRKEPEEFDRMIKEMKKHSLISD